MHSPHVPKGKSALAVALALSIRAQWDSIPKPKQWRESYIKHATSFVRVGAPRGDSSWASPLGLGLEIDPERDPTVLVEGDALPVRVLRRAKEPGLEWRSDFVTATIGVRAKR
jgi:Domain of unknown function (DUF4198)